MRPSQVPVLVPEWGTRKTPPSRSCTKNSVPAFQRCAVRNDLGTTICPLVDNFVVCFMVRPKVRFCQNCPLSTRGSLRPRQVRTLRRVHTNLFAFIDEWRHL